MSLFLGRVVHRADLVDDDFFFLGQLVLVQERAHRHVGEDVEGKTEVLARDDGVHAGGLFLREGVDDPAHTVDLLRYGQRGPPRRPLEEHVLQEV